MRRPQLHPGLRPVWRDATTLQLGTSTARGVVITGLHAADDDLLAALDGTHDLAALAALARRRAMPPGRAGDLVDALSRAGVLTGEGPGAADRAHLSQLEPADRERLAGDGQSWSLAYPPPLDDGAQLVARRRAQHVVVDGAGRLGMALATVLVAAGVGHVQVRDDSAVGVRDVGPLSYRPDEVGRSRAQTAAAALRTWSASTTQPGGPPDLVVLSRDDVIDVRDADDLLRRDQPHLALVCGAERVTVGPLVLPGDGACLRCLDLHRTDRDPAWPRVAAQLLAYQRRAPARGETALGVMAAGLAAVQVLAHLAGRSRVAARGRTLDVLLPDGALERRRWPPHAGCGCTRLPGDGETGAGGQHRAP